MASGVKLASSSFAVLHAAARLVSSGKVLLSSEPGVLVKDYDNGIDEVCVILSNAI